MSLFCKLCHVKSNCSKQVQEAGKMLEPKILGFCNHFLQ